MKIIKINPDNQALFTQDHDGTVRLYFGIKPYGNSLKEHGDYMQPTKHETAIAKENAKYCIELDRRDFINIGRFVVEAADLSELGEIISSAGKRVFNGRKRN